MRVLLTGSSSMLGAHVTRLLVQRGEQVSVLQRRPSAVAAELGLPQTLADLTDASAVSAAMADVAAVIHLAARVGVIGSGEQFHRTNVVGTQVVLEAARTQQVGRLVFISSPSVAHSGRALVGVGTQPADPARARSHYSRTKALAELAVLTADSPGLATIAVRPHLVWGPGDTQLVARIVQRGREGRLALVNGGRALIDTTYIDNAAEAVVAALDRCQAGHGRAFVVTNGQPRTVAELFQRMCQAAGVPGPRRSVPRPAAWAAGALAEAAWSLTGRETDPPMTRFLAGQLATAHWFDQVVTRRVLDWTPRVTIDEGFGRLAESYR